MARLETGTPDGDALAIIQTKEEGGLDQGT